MTHVPWHETAENASEMDTIELTSVGIDVGTTTTHLMISQLEATRKGGYSSFQVTDRETVYQSEIHLTPFDDENQIDVNAIEEIIDTEYTKSGFDPVDVDTGAVIVTGEASRKENADRIADHFSERSGEFVCAAAGANLETLMSAHGSGAVDYSVDEEETVLHIDIGGGTTKLALIKEGFVEDTASINVGAHLVTFDEDGTVDQVEEAAEKIAEDAGIVVEPGKVLDNETKHRLADRFAKLLFEAVDGTLSPVAESLLVTEPLEIVPFDVITFAGGVSEYIHNRDATYYRDLGPELADSILEEVEKRDLAIAELGTGIRATAIGSTQQTVQVSGNTVTITDEAVLPLRNIPMVPYVINHHDEDIESKLLEKLETYDVQKLDQGLAFGFHLHGPPSSEFLQRVADAAVASWKQTVPDFPLIIAVESDVGRSIGEKAAQRTDMTVISVDGIDLDQFGYIDIGEPIHETNGVAVPVTVKSLVFEG